MSQRQFKRNKRASQVFEKVKNRKDGHSFFQRGQNKPPQIRISDEVFFKEGVEYAEMALTARHNDKNPLLN